MVHRDTQRLKEAGEIGRAGSRTERTSHGADQMITGCECLGGSAPHDLACETRRMSFIGIVAKDLRERLTVRFVEYVPRRLAVVAHTHVERRPFSECESARGVVELSRRDAEIEQHAIERLLLNRIEIGCVGMIAVHGSESSRSLEALQPSACGGNRLWIAIESRYPLDARLEQGLRMAASA